jgi:hypothetical protein
MTFASLEKLIREETRKVIENLERSFSLYEEDEKPASEDSDKILVVNKESGKSYYISKKNFDPAKHQKSAPKSPKKEEEEPAADTSAAETPEEEPKPTDTSTTEKPEEEKPAEETPSEKEKSSDEEKPKDDKKGEEKKEEPTKEPNEEKTGLKTVGFLNKVNVEKLDTKTKLTYCRKYDYIQMLELIPKEDLLALDTVYKVENKYDYRYFVNSFSLRKNQISMGLRVRINSYWIIDKE